MDKVPFEIRSSLNSIINLECWYVNSGQGVGATFSISLGKKIARKTPLKNPNQSEEYRHFEGEANLLVWCSWRLDNNEKPITSSDDAIDTIEKMLGILIGKKVLVIDVVPPAWDLIISFLDGYHLKIFCDHLPGDPSYDGNWDLKVGQKILFVGPGNKWGVELEKE